MLAEAGASAILLGREETCGYHSTGRSAAMFFCAYGKPQIRALTRASGPFLLDPPDGFSEAPLTARSETVVPASTNP